MMKLRLSLLSLIMVFAGCATTDPYTGEKKTNKTTSGAAIGAIAGAAIGAATSSKKDREKGILTGAAAGAALGGGAGYYMDQQEKKLRQKLEGTGVGVVRNGDNIELVMPGNVVFDSGKSDIKAQFDDVLDSVALVLAEFKKTNILIEGHTDNTGSAKVNELLSQARADSVKDFLTAHDVSAKRIITAGRSFYDPVASNDTPAGRQANRRVELTLEPIE